MSYMAQCPAPTLSHAYIPNFHLPVSLAVPFMRWRKYDEVTGKHIVCLAVSEFLFIMIQIRHFALLPPPLTNRCSPHSVEASCSAPHLVTQ